VDLSDDSTGACDPVKGLRVFVINPNVIVDGFDQITNAAEGSAADSFSCDFGKPAFDLIEPRRTGWREVQVIARSCSEPSLHGGMFMGAVIIQDQMDVQIGRNGLVDTIETPDAGVAADIRR
jgi:hypothetical protein